MSARAVANLMLAGGYVVGYQTGQAGTPWHVAAAAILIAWGLGELLIALGRYLNRSNER